MVIFQTHAEYLVNEYHKLYSVYTYVIQNWIYLFKLRIKQKR